MAFPQPRPSALFTLVPRTDGARAVVNDARNRCLVSQFIYDDKLVLGLDICPNIPSRSLDCLATLGRSQCDIVVQHPDISKVQCDLQLLPNGVVMLRDRSTYNTTWVSDPVDDFSVPFESGRFREVVLTRLFNRIIGMGKAHRGSIEFELLWHHNLAEKIASYLGTFGGCEDDPQMARTINDDAPTIGPSKPLTRIQTTGKAKMRPRYHFLAQIGDGSFGSVSRAVNVDTGELAAAKTIKVERRSLQKPDEPPKAESEQAWSERWGSMYHSIKREVQTLSRLNCPHVVRYFDHIVDLPDKKVTIYTELMDNTLESLIGEVTPGRPDNVLRHMLRALSYLEGQDLVHYDVTPSNILYRLEPDGSRQFKLADFGLSGAAAAAEMPRGTRLFAAPEISSKGSRRKVDVWSLFATFVYMWDVNEFRTRPSRRDKYSSVSEAVADAATHRDVSFMRAMAAQDPAARSTATAMLGVLFQEAIR